LAVALSLYATCLSLTLISFARGRGFPPILVAGAASSEVHPTVAGEAAWVSAAAAGAEQESSPAEEPSLLRRLVDRFFLHGYRPWTASDRPDIQAGDDILSVGGASVRGSSSLEVFAKIVSSGTSTAAVPLELERGGEIVRVHLPLVPYRLVWPLVLVGLVFVICGALLFVRSPSSATARSAFHAFTAVGVQWSSIWGDSPTLITAGVWVQVIAGAVSMPMVIRFMMLLPPEAPPWPRAALSIPWLFAPLGTMVPAALFGVIYPSKAILPLAALACAAMMLTILLISARNYRASDAAARRKVKWALWGSWFAVVPILAALVLISLVPGAVRILRLGSLVFLAFPVAVAIGVIRHQFLDIDRLLSASLTYNLILVVAATIGFVFVPTSAAMIARQFELPDDPVRWALSLGLAALVVPAGRALRPRIERRLFAERYGIDRGIAALSRQIDASVSEGDVLQSLAEGFYRLFRADSCVLFSRGEAGWVPTVVFGVPTAPVLAPEYGIVHLAEAASRPLDLTRLRERSLLSSLSAVERSILQGLATAIVEPIRVAGSMRSLILLGGKGSGDDYSDLDLTLIRLVTERAGSRLSLRGTLERADEAERRVHALRRYVPRAVAARAQAQDVVSGKCDLSVLFADIRGYTTFSQDRSPEQIFAAINEYTGLVTTLIERCGGSVVEFNGDGMMAVFGAPRSLPHKEAAAVSAACLICEEVPKLRIRPAGSSGFDVRVGIATGDAFVGDIQASDRAIWSAIGNTTNRAARLERLTRELEAQLIVDEATWVAAGRPGAFRRHVGVRLKGRDAAEDVFALGFAPGASA